MSDINQSITDVRAFARQASSLNNIITVLDRLGNLEHSETDLKSRIAALQAAQANAQTELDGVKQSITGAQLKAAALVDAANSDAAGVVADAETRAAELLAAAEAKATEALDAAKAFSAEFAESKLKAEMVLGDLQSAIDAKQSALADLDKQLNAIREKLGV